MDKIFYLNDIENALLNGKGKSNNSYEEENIPLQDWITNWDFRKTNTDLYTHKIHRYPAMFIPQLTRKLIQKFSTPGDTILDIFSGSGTLLVESTILGRNSIGIELNPLALLISKVKLTKLDLNKILRYYDSILVKYFDDNTAFKLLSFKNIDFWYNSSAIKSISKLLYVINKIPDDDFKDFLKVSLSEILREVSLCRHSGFKMHRDPAKLKTEWPEIKLFDYFHKTLIKNLGGLVDYQKAVSDNATWKLINGDSKKNHCQIKKESVDLIITSPPYGDSHTTVAYGQFSRLSSQFLQLETSIPIDIASIDNELLGGRTNGILINDEVMKHSITLTSVLEIFNHRLEKITDKVDYKKAESRFKDVVSFYKDLELTIRNAEHYLKPGKYFILITGSRIVKEIKLHTDLIIAELAENYGFELKGILYRNIINKRMPSKVSSTNVVGEKSATMTKESIIILKKN